MSATRILPVLLLGVGVAWVPLSAQAEWRIFQSPWKSDANSDRKIERVQSGDAAIRINQLEEQLRMLNGQVEDLNFQLLEMQEELRRMQEDNEIRFQELESQRGISPANRRVTRDETPAAAPKNVPEQENLANERDSIGSILGDGSEGLDSRSNTDGSPSTLGTLTFDEKGEVVDSTLGKPIDLTRRGFGNAQEPGRAADSELPGMAILPDSPDGLYDLGYGHIQAGEYEQAEQAFAEYASRYPDNPRVSEARFWLGESLFSQGEYEEAARVFLDTHKQYPEGKMAAQTLLKLGVSLAGMNQRELACATFAEVPKKYPQMSNAVRSALANERQAASCLVN